MNSKLIQTVLVTAVLIGIAAPAGNCQAVEYKDFKRNSTRTMLFEIGFDRHTIEFFNRVEDLENRFTYDKSEMNVDRNTVGINGQILFDADGFHFGGSIISYDKITDLRVDHRTQETRLIFLSHTGDDRKVERIRQGNIIQPFGTIMIEEEDFVRGLVFSVTGNIEIFGEVNKDVVSLFGDVYVSPEAVVRGDVVSVSGRIDADDEASIYGEVYSGENWRAVRRHRFYRYSNELNLGGGGYYNRVDGLAISIDTDYQDRDSLLPSVWASATYAFESKRWRYEAGLEQTILRSCPLAIGGSVYRRLASEDNWLLARAENNAFTLLATEDFMDYYEAEGGTAYLRIRPLSDLTFEGRYQYDETKWLEAERDLWSLFGGNKKFPLNFASVDQLYRQQGIQEIDTTTNATLSARLEYDTNDKDDLFGVSSWALAGSIEWSHPDLQSDFDYTRYILNLRRYQKVHRRAMLMIRAMYGGSDGYLPMYKRYYLGGLGSLHGYRHKEYMGTRFWMVNSEYRIDFPHTDLAASLLWDVGQIANETKLDSNVEIKNSLGVSVYIGNDFRVSLTRRLDSSDDNDPVFYIRLAHVL